MQCGVICCICCILVCAHRVCEHMYYLCCQDSGDESDESIGEQMAKLEELVQKRQQTFNARKVGAEQEKKSAAGEEVADPGPETHDNGSSKTDKFSVPESSAIAETVGPMEYGDIPENDTDSSAPDDSASNSEDSDAGECIASNELDNKGQVITCSEVGESGDHSELRKRTPAAIGEENKLT